MSTHLLRVATVRAIGRPVRLSLCLSVGLATLPAPSLSAQDAPRAIPEAIEMVADGGRAQISLQGADVGDFRAVRVVDPGGRDAVGLQAELGSAKGDRRPLALATQGAQAGEYRVLLEGSRGPVEVALRIVVAAAAAPAPPEIVTARAPASVETGAAVVVGLLVRSAAPLAALEWEWEGRRNEVRLPATTEAKEELRLDAPSRPGRSAIRLVAVDTDGARSTPRDVVVEVVAPAPTPRLESLRLEPNVLAEGDTATLRLRLDTPAPQSLEVALTGQLLHSGIWVLPPPTVTVPAGAREVEAPVTLTGAGLLPGSHSFTIRAELDGTERRAEGSVAGTPTVTRFEAPSWVVAGDTVDVVVVLSHPAPPGGIEVEVRIPQTHVYTDPWGTPMVAAGGETRLTARTVLQRDQATPVEVSWSARTAAHAPAAHPPATLQQTLHARPRIATLNLTRFQPITEASRAALVALEAPAPPGGVEVALEVVPAGILAVPSSVTVPTSATSVGFQVQLDEAPTDGDVEVVIRATLLGEVTERTVTVAAAGG